MAWLAALSSPRSLVANTAVVAAKYLFIVVVSVLEQTFNMYKKKGIETAPQNKYTAVLNPLTLLSLICARSLSFVLFCMLLLQQNERKKESEREGEYKSTASPPPPRTHTTTLLLPHTHTFSLILYIYSLFCAATAAAAQPASCVCVGKHPVHHRLPLLAPCSPAQ